MALDSPRIDPRNDLRHGTLDPFPTFAWLDDDRRPLDWNGPANRIFTRFRDRALQRPIVEHLERVACRQPGAVAVRHGDTPVTFGELWEGVTGLAETLADETQPG